jgi:hypothetical protein
MMFLDCLAYLDQDGAARCGLPAEVRCRFTMGSTDGPMESAMIRCPAGYWFNGLIQFLTWQGGQTRTRVLPQPRPVRHAAPSPAVTTARTAAPGSPSG